MRYSILLLSTLLLATGCTKKRHGASRDGDDATPRDANTATANVDVGLIVEKDGPLPPDPGEAGKATLVGVDTDRDGLRDDVQIWIANAAPDSKKTRTALRQYAMYVQSYLAVSADPEKARVAIQEAAKGQLCLTSVASLMRAMQLRRALKAEMLDTKERTTAELAANATFSGQSIHVSAADAPGAVCKFDPALMEN